MGNYCAVYISLFFFSFFSIFLFTVVAACRSSFTSTPSDWYTHFNTRPISLQQQGLPYWLEPDFEAGINALGSLAKNEFGELEGGSHHHRSEERAPRQHENAHASRGFGRRVDGPSHRLSLHGDSPARFREVYGGSKRRGHFHHFERGARPRFSESRGFDHHHQAVPSVSHGPHKALQYGFESEAGPKVVNKFRFKEPEAGDDSQVHQGPFGIPEGQEAHPVISHEQHSYYNGKQRFETPRFEEVLEQIKDAVKNPKGHAVDPKQRHIFTHVTGRPNFAPPLAPPPPPGGPHEHLMPSSIHMAMLHNQNPDNSATHVLPGMRFMQVQAKAKTKVTTGVSAKAMTTAELKAELEARLKVEAEAKQKAELERMGIPLNGNDYINKLAGTWKPPSRDHHIVSPPTVRFSEKTDNIASNPHVHYDD